MAVTSMTFDETYYLENNPDVQAAIDAGTIPSAEWHWQNYGWSEGRDPNASFDTSYYLENNADVQTYLDSVEQGTYDPLMHLQQYGAAEGRYPNVNWEQYDLSNFDEAAYLAANPDVAAAVEAGSFTNGLQHFMLYGSYETREGKTTDGTVIDDSAVNPTPGTTYTLTKGTLEYTGTEKDDTFTGDTDALQADTTIDGKAGNDTLKVDMKGDFDGFNTGKGLTSVEKVELTNSTSTSKDFDASDIKGVSQWIVNAGEDDFLIDDLAETGGSFTLTQSEGTFNLAFDEDVLDGTSDSITVNLAGVGSKDDNVKIDVDADPTSDALETLALKSNIATSNYVDLSETAVDNVTVVGSGDLKVSDVQKDLESFDASSASGKITADLSTAGTSIKTMKTGSGDDTVTLGGSSKTATIVGGDGTDTVIYKGVADGTSYQLSMSDVESLTFLEPAGGFTFSGKNVSDVSTFTIKDSFSGDAKFADINIDDATVAVDVYEQSAVSGNIKSFDGEGDVTFNLTDTDSDATGNFTGDLNFNSADTFTLSNTTKGDFGTSADTNQEVNASSAETVTIKTSKAGDVYIDEANFKAATKLNLEAGDSDSEINLGSDADSVNLTAVEEIVATGSGSVTMDQTATAPFKGLEDLESVDASDLLGTFKLDITNATGDVTVKGSEVGANTIDVGTGDDTVTGGIEADFLASVGGADTFTGGSGDDDFVFYNPATSAAFDEDSMIDTITDFADGDSIFLGNTAGATVSGMAAMTVSNKLYGAATYSSGNTWADEDALSVEDDIGSFYHADDRAASASATSAALGTGDYEEFTPDSLEDALTLIDNNLTAKKSVLFEYDDKVYLFIGDGTTGNMFGTGGGSSDQVIELQGVSDPDDVNGLIFD